MQKNIYSIFFIILLTSIASKEAPAKSLNQDDLTYAFGNNSAIISHSDLGEIAPLSQQEMMETEGKVAPLVYVASVRTGYLVARGLHLYTRYYYGVWVPPAWRYATYKRPSSP